MTELISSHDRRLGVAFALTALAATLVAYGTLSPPGSSEPALPFTDKQIHALAFAALVLPLGWVRPARALRIAAVAVAFGCVIEVIQPAFGRTGEWGDLVADAAGCLIGLLPGQLRHLLAPRR